MRVRRLKSKQLTRRAPSTVADPTGFHVVVAVHVAQVGQVHRVLCRLLRVAGKPEGLDFKVAPLVSCRRLFGQVPLRRASVDAPPGEDEAENLPRGEDAQPRALGRRRIGSRDAGARRVVGEAVKGTDQSAVAHAPAGCGAQRGSQVRTERPGDADGSLVVAPHDDVLPHPLLLDQCALRYRATVGNEVPPFGKREEGGIVAARDQILFHVLRDTLSMKMHLHGKDRRPGVQGGIWSRGIEPPSTPYRIMW